MSTAHDITSIQEFKSKSEDDTDFKDGDDGGFTPFESITIKHVSNGWMITTSYEDGEEVTEVFDIDGKDNGDLQAVKAIIESMGLENSIKADKTE